MSANRNRGPIRVGLVADEPMRLAGLAAIFDQPACRSQARLLPVTGSIRNLLADEALEYLVIDLHPSSSGLKTLESIRRSHPRVRLIVIGPAGKDELVLAAIAAGARAYLEASAGPAMLCKAINTVSEGSIWAPRRLLSKLVDQLLEKPRPHPSIATPKLTDRERQVLELILTARSNREIASEMGIEERTVRAHLGRLMRKAGVDNRIKLSMAARTLFHLPPSNARRTHRAE